MTSGNLHTSWLSLIDRSGPFLSVQILESALPQGLEVVHTKYKQKLRLAYEEWRDAVDNDDSQLVELHKEWIRLVLGGILEYDNTSLIPNSSDGVKYSNEELATEYVPSFVVKSPVSNRVRFFVDVLAPDTDFEKPLEGDKWPASFVEKMTLLCRSQKVRYGLLTNGDKWTIVSAPIGATSGTATWYSRLWRYEPVTLKAFQTLLGVRRCFGPESETLDTLLDSSLNSYEEVTNTLGEQVRRAVEVLIQSLDSADQDRNRELLDGIPPSELYDASVTVMMRLVFLLCAEERGLLLLGDPIYDQFYAVATLRAQLAEEAGKLGPEVLERRHDAWSRLLATFRAVYGGIEHEALRLPPLGGSLFDPDKYPFLEGRKADSSWKDSEAAPLPIDNRTVLLLLTALQILEQKGGALHLSYRALDVEQIGHVYEGLLDSTVSRVPTESLALMGSKQTKSTLLSLLELEAERIKSTDSLSSYLEEKIERKPAALLRALNATMSDHEYGTLLLACGGDEALATRIKPFFHLLQMDIWGHPLVYKTGSYAVTKGLDRKETGTHYTPKHITEAVVQNTLEPLLYDGPVCNSKKDTWVLKKPHEILNLKICDPAMGSAAFLVQACRWIAEHLVMSWELAEKAGEKIGSSGVPSNHPNHSEDILPTGTHDRLIIAKRLVAEKCLYGVDINPMAVELSKLSMWLVTMSKGKPFEFLDDKFVVGNSVIGINKLEQLQKFNLKSELSDGPNLFTSALSKRLKNVVHERIETINRSSLTIFDVHNKSSLRNIALQKVYPLSCLADVLVETTLVNCKNMKSLSSSLGRVVSQINLNKDDLNVHQFFEGKYKFKFFHWPIEFPEVFQGDNQGFDSIIGNPPFAGGKRISLRLGEDIFQYFKYEVGKSVGTTDLCVFFLRRCSSLLKKGGTLGLITSDIVSQGDSRVTGLEYLTNSDFVIYRAISSMDWPGQAGVKISHLHIYRGSWTGDFILDDKIVPSISSYLRDGSSNSSNPQSLRQNKDICFTGHYLMGQGFIITLEQYQELMDNNPDSKAVIFDYLIGDDLNNALPETISAKAINFDDLPLEDCQNRYPRLLSIIEASVKSEREALEDCPEKTFWWKYARRRPALSKALIGKNRTLVIPFTAKYVIPCFVQSQTILAHPLVVIPDERYSTFAVLQSSIHLIWVWRYCSTNLNQLRYTTKTVLLTFPFPRDEARVYVEDVGNQFYKLREETRLHLNISNNDLFNLVHSEKEDRKEIIFLRESMRLLDEAVARAYGWTDIDLEHGFHQTKQGIRYTISETASQVVLERLLNLNQEIASREENQPTKKSKSKSKKSKDRQEADLGESE